MATRNEKSPLTRNASGQRCAARETGAPTGTPSHVIDTAAENFSTHPGRAYALTAKDALAAIETFEIVGENNDSREPNADDRFILTEFIAHAFGGYAAEQHEAAPAEGAIDPSEQLIKFSGHSLTLSGAQLLEALDFIAPDRDRDQLESELTFQRGEGHAGNGMYCWVTEYPEEGAIFIEGSTAGPTETAPVPAARVDSQPGLTIINSAYTHLLACTRCGAPAMWTDEEMRQQSLASSPSMGQREPHANITAAARDVLAERRRQVDQEGWTPAHDDKSRDHELSCAAGCYAMYTLAYPAGDPPPAWPWAADWWKPTTHRRNLVKAGALIQAAIERLDRTGDHQ
ncbi:hypothetical protein [Burkholderia sp. BCC1630]|uniref:hypothetical protein n=1 Tax=Burkholderia sp. BCC1630 TaxID=2676304 RepID=UPI001FC81E09|nr:hypothetical protein [Burkholderia sp. BCC1630]